MAGNVKDLAGLIRPLCPDDARPDREPQGGSSTLRETLDAGLPRMAAAERCGGQFRRISRAVWWAVAGPGAEARLAWLSSAVEAEVEVGVPEPSVVAAEVGVPAPSAVVEAEEAVPEPSAVVEAAGVPEPSAVAVAVAVEVAVPALSAVVAARLEPVLFRPEEARRVSPPARGSRCADVVPDGVAVLRGVPPPDGGRRRDGSAVGSASARSPACD